MKDIALDNREVDDVPTCRTRASKKSDGKGKVNDKNRNTGIPSFPAESPLCIAEVNSVTPDKKREKHISSTQNSTAEIPSVSPHHGCLELHVARLTAA